MYETKYVKKRKKRKAVAIGSGVSAGGIAVLAIVAFLGRYTGTFTVKLDTGDLALSLSQTRSFEQPSSFLRVDSLPSFEELTYAKLPSKEALDNEDMKNGPQNVDGSEVGETCEFFKYTFFVKNVGTISTRYTFDINILDHSASEDGQWVDDTLRVMVFDNDATDDGVDSHNCTIYAKQSATAHKDENGETTFKEYVSVDGSQDTDEKPQFAEMFASDSQVASFTQSDFKMNDIRRYTLVIWLEGEDPQSGMINPNTGKPYGAPEGASIKLGVQIKAYEN